MLVHTSSFTAAIARRIRRVSALHRVERMRLPLGLPFVPTLARRAFVAMAEPRPLLRGVVFDMDGTLTNPNLDFGVMYKRCGVDRSQDILEAIAQMPAADAALLDTSEMTIEQAADAARRIVEAARARQAP